jgi:hypothetical protein
VERATQAVIAWLHLLVEKWQRFWFTPTAPHTLALLRILNGAMLFYTHLVWGKNLLDFLGPNAWINRSTAQQLNSLSTGTNYTWSYLYYVESPAILWCLHLAALLILACYTLGLYTRVTAVLAWIITLSYCHRLVGLQYGLDQINTFLVMYLMLAPCGEVYSLDAWLANRANPNKTTTLSTATTIATRLIQLHLCVIYFFGGVSKLRGEMWWDGSAVWFAMANLEYQTLNLTWLIHARWLVALLTHVTVLWETFYCVLVWPRWLRPIILALAVAVHGFIAFALGMITFGLAMISANLVFVPPQMVESAVRRLSENKPPHSERV